MASPRITIFFPGQWATDHYESTDHFTSKIGGIPDFPNSSFQDLPCELLQCAACRSHLCLVAQIYAPLSEHTLNIEERSIYVFCCPMPNCNGSPFTWKALRFQKKSDHLVLPKNNEQVNLSVSTASRFEDEDNSDSDIDFEALSKAFSEIESSKTAPKKIQKKTRSERAYKIQNEAQYPTAKTVLPCFYIDAVEEPNVSNLSSFPSTKIPNPGDDHEDEAWDQETYEYDKALHVDRTYLKFKKHLDASPSQCVRYSFGGKPMHAMATNMDPSICNLCGCARHFEMQLLPPLIYFLQEHAEKSQENIIQNWNWITLLIYTCSKACFVPQKASTNGWIVVEEFVAVQGD